MSVGKALAAGLRWLVLPRLTRGTQNTLRAARTTPGPSARVLETSTRRAALHFLTTTIYVKLFSVVNGHL